MTTGPSGFLQALWGDQPPGLVQTWEMRTKTTICHQHTHVDELTGQADVYTCVATAGKRIHARRRGTAQDAAAIAGLWLDLDVNGGPTGKTGELPSQDIALEVAHAHLEPTLTVDSGYGVHAWYLLPAPWRFRTAHERDQAARLAAGWYALHRATCIEHGGGLGATHDLARLLRLPGTVNAKNPQDPRPVRVLQRGPRHRLRVLEDLAHTVPLPADRLPGETAHVRALPLSPELRARVELLLDQVPEFASAWRHETANVAPWSGWSLSEWDMSVANIAAQGDGFTPQDLASIVRAHRLRWRPGDRKANRVDYLAGTIAKARAKPGPLHGVDPVTLELAWGKAA